MRNELFMDENGYLEGYYEDPNANQPAVWRECQHCGYNGNSTRDHD
jgi:hypothetical protein